jgi:hypothetical protein
VDEEKVIKGGFWLTLDFKLFCGKIQLYELLKEAQVADILVVYDFIFDLSLFRR